MNYIHIFQWPPHEEELESWNHVLSELEGHLEIILFVSQVFFQGTWSVSVQLLNKNSVMGNSLSLEVFAVTGNPPSFETVSSLLE